MKKWGLFLALLFLLPRTEAWAYGEGEKWAHLYVAAGALYGLGSVRLGHKNYEIGMMNPRAFGGAYMIRAGNPYVSFGAILNQNLIPGLYGGVGVMWDFFNHLSIRLELNGSSGFDGYSHSEGLLGLGVYF